MALFLILKKIIKEDDWQAIKDSLEYIWTKDSHYAELKQNEIMRERFEILSGVDEYVGKYISDEWVRKNILRQTDEDIKVIDAQIKRSIEHGTLVGTARHQLRIVILSGHILLLR